VLPPFSLAHDAPTNRNVYHLLCSQSYLIPSEVVSFFSFVDFWNVHHHRPPRALFFLSLLTFCGYPFFLCLRFLVLIFTSALSIAGHRGFIHALNISAHVICIPRSLSLHSNPIYSGVYSIYKYLSSIYHPFFRAGPAVLSSVFWALFFFCYFLFLSFFLFFFLFLFFFATFFLFSFLFLALLVQWHPLQMTSWRDHMTTQVKICAVIQIARGRGHCPPPPISLSSSNAETSQRLVAIPPRLASGCTRTPAKSGLTMQMTHNSRSIGNKEGPRNQLESQENHSSIYSLSTE
jgi:hypothetical protein